MLSQLNLYQCKPNALRVAVTGDNHLGHPTTATSNILHAILDIVPDDASYNHVDLLVFNGDLFDNPMMLKSEYRNEIILSFITLLKRCKKFNIAVRVLEGTPSHDYKQSQILEELNSAIGVDLKYIDTLSIEKIESNGLSFLWVPDEWSSSANTTLNEVKELLTASELTMVDYAFMHGYFAYQLPEIASEDAHDIEAYEAIVRYNIFINHVHVFSQKGKVTAPGSIERLAHGEESDKGYVIRDESGVVFMINTNATKYITVDCVGLESENAYNKLTALAKTLPDYSLIRIKANKADSVFHTLGYFKQEFPKITWSTVRADKKDSRTVMDTVAVAKISRIPTITKSNIVSFSNPD